MILPFQITGAYLISDFYSLCFLASRFPFSLYGIIPVILGIFSLLLLMLCGFFGYQCKLINWEKIIDYLSDYHISLNHFQMIAFDKCFLAILNRGQEKNDLKVSQLFTPWRNLTWWALNNIPPPQEGILLKWLQKILILMIDYYYFENYNLLWY